MGEEVCKEVEGRNNERGGERWGGEGVQMGGLHEWGEAEECVKRPRRTCQGTN